MAEPAIFKTEAEIRTGQTAKELTTQQKGFPSFSSNFKGRETLFPKNLTKTKQALSSIFQKNRLDQSPAIYHRHRIQMPSPEAASQHSCSCMLFSSTRKQNKTVLVLLAVLQALKLLSPLNSNPSTCGGNTAQFIVTGAGIIFLCESVLAVSREWSKSWMLMYYQPVILSLKLSDTVSAGHRMQHWESHKPKIRGQLDSFCWLLLAIIGGEGEKKKSKAHRSFSPPPTQYCFSHVSDEKHSPMLPCIVCQHPTYLAGTNSNAFSKH